MNTSECEIVIVEDNPNDAELIMRALRKHNLANRIMLLKDGAELLDLVFAQGAFADRSVNDTPKVVLLDLKLPKVDGIEALRQMKSDGRTRRIPVVVLTSSTEERDLRDAYELGVNSYVAKPINFADFATVVAQLGLYWLATNKLPAR